jgi:flagellar basal body rod protein FlgG
VTLSKQDQWLGEPCRSRLRGHRGNWPVYGKSTAVDLWESRGNPANGSDAVNPYRLSPSQAATADQDHSYTQEQLAYDHGKMDFFPGSLGQGDMQNTQNPLDLAIEGAGFFRVQRPSGDIAFTRAGNLRVDETGRLVTQHGEIIEPAISVPPETTALTIKPNGMVLATLPGKQDPTELGQLQLTTFTNPSALEAIGNNLFQPTGASGQELQMRPGEQGAGTVSQGFLESSNVKAVEEMIDMISTQRSYEMNSKVIQTADQMLQRLTQLR